MKRSHINAAIRWAEAQLAQQHIALPRYASWNLSQWQQATGLDALRVLMLGWDVTDFGTGHFDETGAVLYTLRNGSLKNPALGVPYCEKLIVMADGQRLPCHYHVAKTEDIIVRAGGPLQLFLWQVDPETGKTTDAEITVRTDGLSVTVMPGEPLYIDPGNSITLTPYMAHVFGPASGTDAILGEVSAVNDDTTDNYFLEPVSRFAQIEEDEPIEHPLCNEYATLFCL